MYFKKILLLVLSFFTCHYCLANPTGIEQISGKVAVDKQLNVLYISQSSSKAILEWKDFSIEKQEQVIFHLKDVRGATLNRVIGNSPSLISGQLQSNGKLYLINERGIIVNSSGKICAKSFTASCLDVSNKDFLSEDIAMYQSDLAGKFINLGSIQVNDGDIQVFASEILNDGFMLAGKGSVTLAATNHLFLSKEQDLCIDYKDMGSIENKGVIQALSAKIKAAGKDIYSLAINQQGIIEAKGIEKQGGHIVLQAEKGITKVSGSLSAQQENEGGQIVVAGGDNIWIEKTSVLKTSSKNSGGSILIGGDYKGQNSQIPNTKKLFVAKETVCFADATENGCGGKVIFWAEDENLFGGKVFARGGKFGGNGGFVEVSCPKEFYYRGGCDTRAPLGKVGELVLDPSDITVSTSASSPTFPTSPGNYNPTGASATLNTTDLANATNGLGATNITISTAAGSGGNGDVTFANDVTWSAATELTVIADRRILINPGVTLSNTNSGNNFDAFDLQANLAGGSTGGSSTDAIDIQGTITTVNGNISFNSIAGPDIGDSAINVQGTVSTTGTGSNSGNITMVANANSTPTSSVTFGYQSSGTTSVVDGAISITGTGGSFGSTNFGINISSGNGINATGSSPNADPQITLVGNGGAGTNNNDGIVIDGSGVEVSSNAGNISITGTAGGTGSGNDGITIINNGSINSTTGNITINGTGAGSNSDGIDLTSGGSIYTTGSGNVTITGIEGTGTSFGIRMTNIANRIGNALMTGDITLIVDAVNLSAGQILSSGTLTIQPRTVSRGMGLNASVGGGLLLSSTVLSSILQDGFTETIFGRVDGTGQINLGAQTYTDPLTVQSLSGTINVNGAVSVGSNNVKFLSDSINISNSITGSGSLTIEPGQTSTTIGLGNSATGTLNLTGTEIGNLANGFSSITFGKTTQDSTVDMQALTYNDPITIYGKQIDVNGAISAGSNDVTLNVGPASSGTLNLDATITTSGTVAINGGSSSDTFNINVTGQTAVLDGSSGINTLTSPNAANTWNITSNNAGNAFGITFTNIANLTGGNLSDTYVFSDLQGVTGQVDGGAPANTNTLNYSAFSSPVIINKLTATSGTASNIDNGYINIENITGNVINGNVTNRSVTNENVIDNNISQLSRFYFTNVMLLLSEVKHYSLVNNFFLWQFDEKAFSRETDLLIVRDRKQNSDKNSLSF